MDDSVATGGFMLLGIVIFIIGGIIATWCVMASMYRASQAREHKRRVERSVRQAYEDENTRQNYARKMLANYEVK